MLDAYLSSCHGPAAFIDETLRPEALSISCPFTIVLGHSTQHTYLVHVDRGEIRYSHNLGQGNFVIG